MGGYSYGKMSEQLASLLPMIYLVPSLSFNVSMSSGNSNLNLASVTSNFDLGFRQFDGSAAQSLRFLQNMILRKNFVD